MQAGVRVVAVLGLAGLVSAGCGGEDEPTPPEDSVTIVLEGTPATFSDDMAEVSILADGTAGATNVRLLAPAMQLTLVLPAPPASFPGQVTGSITYLAGGGVFSNGAAPITVTRLDPGFGGIVEGSFTGVTLTGSASLTVSGSFRATRIN